MVVLPGLALERTPDRATSKKVEILKGFAQRPVSGKSRRLILRFLVSPTELVDDGTGAVGAMRLVRNTLYATATGTLQPLGIDFKPFSIAYTQGTTDLSVIIESLKSAASSGCCARYSNSPCP